MPKPQVKDQALLVTRNFPPLVGGMEKLNFHVFKALQSERVVSLCGPSGCGEFVSQVEIAESAIRPLPLFLLKTLSNTLRLGLKRRPRIFFAGSGLTAPIVWLAARVCGARAVVYLHGLDLVAPSRVYQALWLPFIRHCDLAIANSASTKALALGKGLKEARLQVLNPGVDVPELERGQHAADAFRERFQLGAGPLLLSVGRLTRRKGLAEFIAKALPLIVESRPEVILVVIGEEASDALRSHGASERQRILEAAKAVGLEQHVRLLGRCDEESLRNAYDACNLHVFPVLDLPGDVEGFGMVALEAAAHSMPTVAFTVGGVPDAVAHERTGTLVRSGDYEGFGRSVLAQLDWIREPSFRYACQEFARSKAWPVFSSRLNDMLNEIT